ncbi:unnamed protein product [Clavelina lepadiformis]|uniref:Secreted protein n=1 Tax=Clavelina lepadiformis TaxID=159417 RepID=A0ABP0FR02_CLALP
MMMKLAIIFCVAFLALCALASAGVIERKLEDTFQPKDGYRFDEDSKKAIEEWERLKNDCSVGNVAECTDAQIQLLRLQLTRLRNKLLGINQDLDSSANTLRIHPNTHHIPRSGI